VLPRGAVGNEGWEEGLSREAGRLLDGRGGAGNEGWARGARRVLDARLRCTGGGVMERFSIETWLLDLRAAMEIFTADSLAQRSSTTDAL